MTTLKTLVRRMNFHPHTLNSSTRIPTAVALHRLPLSFAMPCSSKRKIAGQAVAAYARDSKRENQYDYTDVPIVAWGEESM